MTVSAYYCAAIISAVFAASTETRAGFGVIWLVFAVVYFVLAVRKERAALHSEEEE